jgi:hypothetical protein
MEVKGVTRAARHLIDTFMLRRMLLQQAEAVTPGKAPIGVSFGPASPLVRTEAGNFLLEA